MMYYEYYRGICICDGEEIYLPMRTRAGAEVQRFPVMVYNVDNVALGIANNKEQYITLWNANAANRAFGVLTGLVGPFSFTLITKSDNPPPYVKGETDGSAPVGIFSAVFTSQFA